MGGVVILVLRWGKVENPRSEQGFFFFQRELSLFLGCVVCQKHKGSTQFARLVMWRYHYNEAKFSVDHTSSW